MNMFTDCCSLVSFKVIGDDDDPAQMGRQFDRYFEENYRTSPVFSLGTLEQAVNEAFNAPSMEDVRLTLFVRIKLTLQSF